MTSKDESNIHFESDRDIEVKIIKPDRIDIFCKELKFTDYETNKEISFELDEETLDNVAMGNFSNIQRLIFSSGKNRYEFSKLREEAV